MPGGIGNHAYFLAKELTSLGLSVAVLTEPRERSEGQWRAFVNENADLTVIGVRRRSIPYFTYCERILNAKKLLRKKRWDAVVFSGKFSVWLNGILPGTRSIVVVHGSEIKQRGIFKYLFGRGLRRAAVVVCVSAFTKSQLTAEYPDVARDNVVVINNGIRNDWNPSEGSNKGSTATSLELVTVGGIHKRKGHANVLRALPRILSVFPGAKYHIVGMPIEKGELLELINTFKLHEHVVFHHGLSDVQVRELLQRAHISITLSEHLGNGHFEGFGIAIVEAMALGLPAIGSKNSGIADAISHGCSGLLVDPRNPDEIVDALRQILSDYDRYSSNARASADRLRWRNQVKEYARLINDREAQEIGGRLTYGPSPSGW